MKITFLGTGTSTGVPEIGCKCKVCASPDERDRRLRCSILVEVAGKRILIDCGPDFRQQMLRNKVDSLDAVLITHEHYDHVGGLDDLRPFSRDTDIALFAEEMVVQAIRKRMPYAFREDRHWGLPHFNIQVVDLHPFEAAGISVTPVRIMHGALPILGFRIGDMAYLTDIKDLPEAELIKLQGLELLIIEALRKGTHVSHEGLDEALQNIARIRPKKAYLTHLSHGIGLQTELEKELPAGVFCAYDGLVSECAEPLFPAADM